MNFDYSVLWDYVSQHFHCGPYSIHGPDHWRRVKRNGEIVAKHSGAKLIVVQLFALFHDSCRENDGYDPDHGKRGAELASQLRGEQFDIADDEFDMLYYACEWHTHEKHHTDPTIGTCWDADRLDLGRVGTVPDAEYMSTDAGKRAAMAGNVSVLLD